MVEYSFRQFMAMCSLIMEVCELQKFTSSDLDLLCVRLFDPNSDGTIPFDLYLSNSRFLPMS